MYTIPDRTPPQAIDAEQYTLSCALRNTDARERVLEKLDTGNWYLLAHRCVFDAIAYLHHREAPLNLVTYETVAEELRKRGQLDQIGGIAYLLMLNEAVLFPSDVEAHLNAVWEASVRRRVIEDGQHLDQLAYDESVPVEQLEALIQRRADTPLSRDLSEIVTAAEWMQATGDTYGPRAVGKPQTYYRTGFAKLDSYLEFAGGSLIIIAARPSVGKTALGLEMLLNGAILKQPSGLISIEMPKEQMGLRMQCSYPARQDLGLGVSIPSLRDHAKEFSPAELTPEEIKRVTKAEQEIGKLPVYIVDRGPFTPGAIRAYAKQMVRKFGIKALFVDYLGIIEHDKAENQTVMVTRTARMLKSLARQLDICVIALSQLNRQSELRGKSERRPRLADLRESGAIEQEADGVILLHREAYQQRSEHPGADDGEGEMEAIVAKSRNGATGIVRLQTSMACGRIYEPNAYQYQEAPPEHWDDYQDNRPVAEAPDEGWWK